MDFIGDSLVDISRIVPKSEGGEYSSGNLRKIDPVDHMKEQGIFKERDIEIEELKSMMDDRRQTIKLKVKVNNQLLSYNRKTDIPNKQTIEFLELILKQVESRFKLQNKEVADKVISLSGKDPLIKAALSVPSVGPIFVAYLTCYVEVEKDRHASGIWAYVGYDKPSHERYVKGIKGGGNKELRNAVYVAATVFIRQNSPYREIYDRTKRRLENSKTIVKSRNTQGKLIEVPWCDAKPSHRHGAAIRKMMKHFLADYWYVGRTLKNLPTSPLYVNERLGHEGAVIEPYKYGWVY